MEKLNATLAKSESLQPYFRGIFNDYIAFFKNSQSAFKGEKKTYEPIDGTIDEPNRRGNVGIQTTVQEKLDYFIENASDYMDTVLAVEATNASGDVRAELIVGKENWGPFTSLELLRLKSLVEHGDMGKLFENIPVRSDSEEWNETDNEQYQDRNVFESPLMKGTNKTTIKESYILADPNLKNAGEGNYTPQIGQKTTVEPLGEFTVQKFSGEFTHRQRAAILKKRAQLVVAIAEALKRANDVEVVSSDLSGKKVFEFLLS